MRGIVLGIICVVFVADVNCQKYENDTLDPASRQLLDFQLEHSVPIGLWTKSSGEPTEIRDTISINSDLFNNQLLLDTSMSLNRERLPERVVHAKGTGAFGYFVVTNDVSKYTYADVFNGIGKKTPIATRFSLSIQNNGGNDLARDFRGLAVKFYTKEGNLDLTCLSTPVYLYRDPFHFTPLIHGLKRNPVTNLFDFTSLWDAITMNPIFAHSFLWVMSDMGVPNGYRKMDAFPIHTFELANKHGESHYVRFNFRTEQGVENLINEQIVLLQDADYHSRDLYNAIKRKDYPSWRLEMDVMTVHDVQNVDYDPFDVTRLWKNGTYSTVQIGRLVLNKNVDNMFRAVEQSAYNPSNLVPGIPGPSDFLFKGRKVFYRDTQNYRLGRNHNNIEVNMPLYAKTINRDGVAPVRDNEKDAPNYYPNSFNGVIPCVDERIPKKKLLVLESNAVDLEPISVFYNQIVATEDHKQRFVNNIVLTLIQVLPKIQERVINLLLLAENELGTRVRVGLDAAIAVQRAQQMAQTTTTSLPVEMHSTQAIPTTEIPVDIPTKEIPVDTPTKEKSVYIPTKEIPNKEKVK